jgi:hypothetical protein
MKLLVRMVQFYLLMAVQCNSELDWLRRPIKSCVHHDIARPYRGLRDFAVTTPLEAVSCDDDRFDRRARTRTTLGM